MSTGIQWTDETWNPVVGCTQVSPGCAHCYAKELHDKRQKAYWAGKDVAPQYAQPFETVQLLPSRLKDPLHWRKPRRVFVNSVSDLFHDDVPDEFIDRVFAVMTLAEWHTFQILTKRPARMLAYMTERWQPATVPPQRVGDDRQKRVHRAVEAMVYGFGSGNQFGGDRWWTPAGSLRATFQPWPLPNVWLGVSVENQRFANERIPLLVETPAAVRFLSCEPLLGPIDFDEAGSLGAEMGDPSAFSALSGEDGCDPPIPGIDWVIVGGESGNGARPCDVHWIADILAQCCFAGVPAFVKQLGALPGFRLEDEEARGNVMPGYHHYDEPSGLYIKKLKDSHGGDPDEWPEELRVREFPASGVRA